MVAGLNNNKSQEGLNSTRFYRNLIILLIGSIIVTNSFIIFSNNDGRVFFIDITINITAAIALGLALITVYRQKTDGLYGKTYASLALGLALWFIAELVWAYFELALNIITPFPSIADAFWLAGYGFFAYHLYRIYNFIASKQTIRPVVVIIVSVATAIIFGYIVGMTINIAESSDGQNKHQNHMILLLVSIAYPILDAVLIVPAILILWSVRAGQLASAHWTLLALALLFTAVADSGFGYFAVLNIDTAQEVKWKWEILYNMNKVKEVEWIWDILYNATYLSIAAALCWHNYFFIFDERKVMKKWQKENR